MSTPKTIFLDLDGTLCTEERTFERSLATPLPGAQEALRKFYDAGHTVIIWTGRGWEQFKMTKHWLDTNGFVYHQILMGKPIASVFIDDRGRQFQGWDKDYLPD
jgi:hydroxymethylpyrimidine pyrophosphatase-like HAD family hydrolase